MDETLAEKGTRFLTGDTLCCFDCELMPKLQHIRVAGKYFENFDIPQEFTHLWQYVKEMYELDAFVQVSKNDTMKWFYVIQNLMHDTLHLCWIYFLRTCFLELPGWSGHYSYVQNAANVDTKKQEQRRTGKSNVYEYHSRVCKIINLSCFIF